MYTPRQGELGGEGGRQGLIVLDFAADVADHPAELGAQGSQSAVGALELLGMGVALMLDQGELADPLIGLAKLDPVLFGQAHEPLSGAVHQPSVGGEHYVLGLHRGVDDHLAEIRRLGRPGAGSYRQALLDQGRQPVFAHALTPTGHRQTVEDQAVAKELFAAEELEIGILHPAIAQRLVGEVVHGLQNRQPRHQPRRQRRLAGAVGVDRAEPVFQEPPVDPRGQLRQGMVHVDDLIQPSPEHIGLTRRSALHRTHLKYPSLTTTGTPPVRAALLDRGAGLKLRS